MANFKFVEWLVLWLQETTSLEFDWDKGNRTKSALKHAVTSSEAEEVFRAGLAAPLGLQVSPATSEERFGIVGPSAAGRMLQVVFTIRNGKVRPISARPAAKWERKYHEAYLLREISEGI